MKRIIALIAFFVCISAMQNTIYAQEEIQVKTFKELTSDLSARTNRRYDLNDDPCALIKVEYPVEGATFEGTIIGDVEWKNNQYWVYVSKGTKRIRIHLPEHPMVVVEFSDYQIAQAESNVTYIVDFKFPSKFKVRFYGEVGFLVGTTMGAEVALGTYLNNFNVEFNAMLPTVGAEKIYWMSDEQNPVAFNYKPSIAFGGRIGYAINAGQKFRFTPQVGMMYMGLTETAVDNTSLTPAKKANCASLVIDCKIQYMFSKHFGVSITPEYDLAIAKSKGFKALSEASDKIKKWNNGIGVKVAVNVEF